MGGLVDAREIDHRRIQRQNQSSSSRSRSRDKSYRTAVGGGGAVRKVIASSDLKAGARDLVSMSGRTHDEGNGHFRKHTNGSSIALDSTFVNGSPIEENSFMLGFQRCSSKKSSGTPIKALIEEEMPREMEIRRPSPSVIARLMGLDALPPPQLSHKQLKEMTGSGTFQKTSPVGYQGSRKSDEDHSRRMSTNEHQEFKDVFEVMESSKIEKQKNRPVRKGMSCSKENKSDVDFIRQKFMDAKYLSTDETWQDSKEMNDALEILDSNKDIFLKFLQEPNSLFTKHLHDMQCSPPSLQTSHITILRSSKLAKYGSSEECSESERRAESHAHMRKDVESSFRKPITSCASHSQKENNSFHSHKLSKSQYTSKTDTCLHPTRIVVLKPSLEKAQNRAKTVTFLGSPENIHLGSRRHREFQMSSIQELHEEGRQQQKLLDDVEVMRHKAKGSREIAREITKQVRQSVSSSTDKVFTTGFSRHIKDGRSSAVSGLSSLNNFESHQQTSDNFDDWNNIRYPPSSYSSESSVSREARKRLSERWKTTHRFQEVGLADRGSNTLGEMLALSDSETPRMAFDSLTGQKVSSDKSSRDEVLGKLGSPSGISSRDGWKDGCFINLPRSVSLPATSTVYGTPKLSSRYSDYGRNNYYRPSDSLYGNSNRRSSRRSFRFGSDKLQSFDSAGEENKIPVREIHMKPKETGNIINVNILADEEPMPLEVSDSAISDVGLLDAKMISIPTDDQVQHLAKVGESSGNECNKFVLEETSCDHFPEDSIPSQCDRTESGSPVCSKEADQPSPVSVLDPPSEDESSSSECFEKISADLQELRMQLQLLKLESEDSYAEESEVLMSDEDTVSERHSILQTVEREHTFTDGDERESSYLLDVLASSGIHGIRHDRFFNACYLPEQPVDPIVFEKLENKYGGLVAWSRSERKLFFDHTNSIMAEILAPCMDLHPWVQSKRRVGSVRAYEGLAEEVGRMVVSQRKELSRGNPEEKVLDPRWFEFGADVDMIGREIARMLKEDLLEEIVSEFVCVFNWM